MYFVYYKDRIIDFSDRLVAGSDDAVKLKPGEVIGITKMLEKLENSKYLCVISKYPERSFKEFAARFTLVEAAGGVVENDREDILMIYRNNRWDLPKGYVEAGEDFADAAVREVLEETGLETVEQGEIITTTHHFYPLEGKWIMKRTWWFAMTGNGPSSPQTEEGITKVRWVPSSKIPAYSEHGFASVREVLKLTRPEDENFFKLENILM